MREAAESHFKSNFGYIKVRVFEKIFGMSKDSFVALKDWKKKALKQKHNLW